MDFDNTSISSLVGIHYFSFSMKTALSIKLIVFNNLIFLVNYQYNISVYTVATYCYFYVHFKMHTPELLQFVSF